jgi:putative ABC transport system ATP-binding protein
MIELSNVSLNFGKGSALLKTVLNELSLSVPAGQWVSILGSNGAGKSTLIGAISGEHMVDAGSIRIDHTDVTALPPESRAHLVAKVFQDPTAGTFSDLSIEDNLLLARMRGKKKGLGFLGTHIHRASNKVLLSKLGLGLEYRLNEPVANLSGGQRQALSLLMATLVPAKVLLLDEHTAALDPRTERMILELTARIVREHKLTTLMVTHSLEQALAWGDRIVFLSHGKVVQDIGAAEKATLNVGDLLKRFGSAADDRMLL